MVIYKGMAGLGNQMFEYACARALALRNNTEVRVWRAPADCKDGEVKICDSSSGTNPLEPFAIQARDASSQDLLNIQYRIIEKPFKFYPELLHAKGNVLLDGFWQSEQYFTDVRTAIREDLEFKDAGRMRDSRERIAALRQNRNAAIVAVHVRRGDYVIAKNSGIFHNLSTNWFNTAMARFPANVAFLIFSDDMPWCRATFTGPRINYSNGRDALQDLALMRACDGYIISNSSFSWWGAWLSDNPHAPVIAPSADCWFGPVLQKYSPHDASHIVPDGWIRQQDT